jgi:hypothetical protein
VKRQATGLEKKNDIWLRFILKYYFLLKFLKMWKMHSTEANTQMTNIWTVAQYYQSSRQYKLEPQYYYTPSRINEARQNMAHTIPFTHRKFWLITKDRKQISDELEKMLGKSDGAGRSLKEKNRKKHGSEDDGWAQYLDHGDGPKVCTCPNCIL